MHLARFCELRGYVPHDVCMLANILQGGRDEEMWRKIMTWRSVIIDRANVTAEEEMLGGGGNVFAARDDIHRSEW